MGDEREVDPARIISDAAVFAAGVIESTAQAAVQAAEAAAAAAASARGSVDSQLLVCLTRLSDGVDRLSPAVTSALARRRRWWVVAAVVGGYLVLFGIIGANTTAHENDVRHRCAMRAGFVSLLQLERASALESQMVLDRLDHTAGTSGC